MHPDTVSCGLGTGPASDATLHTQLPRFIGKVGGKVKYKTNPSSLRVKPAAYQAVKYNGVAVAQAS